MKKLQIRLKAIRQESNADFVGLALANTNDVSQVKDIRWCFVEGNSSENYKKIRLQLGRGIAGLVWRTGRAYFANNLLGNKAKMMEYPIARMEKLETVLALPVLEKGQVIGVLLVGYRSNQEATTELLHILEKKVSEITRLVVNEYDE